MAGITGQGTTFNLPNYVGDLFAVTPTDTPFLSLIGGLTGGKRAKSTDFEWQGYDLRAAGQNVALEGANAPTAQSRVRFNVSNVVQVHQEVVEVSYTKLAASGAFSGVNNGQAGLGQDELDWQIEQTLKHMARDVEFSFIQGTFAKPADNLTPRKTRGIMAAIVTNIVTSGVPEAITKAKVDDLLQKVWDNGGIKETETATLMANSKQKRALTAAYATSGNYQETSRNVAGLRLTTIQTDFGVLNLMLNRYMPVAEVAVVSAEQCSPVLMEVPDKGFLFAEPLAKIGSAERVQVYGEVGLEYGNERAHGKITNLL